MLANGFQIRRATFHDLAGVEAVLRAVWPGETFNTANARRQLEAGGLLVAEAAGEVIGLCSGFALPNRWEVDLLAVLPGHRGRGVGRSLIRANLPAKQPARAVIAASNTASTAAFRAAGFTTDGITRTLLVFPPEAAAEAHRAACTLHHVRTLLYSGIWLEDCPTDQLQAGIARARRDAYLAGADLVGCFLNPQQAASTFGGSTIGEYHWWHIAPPNGGNRD
jgi:GNAT superfamily N-acetyltransferase